MDDKILVAIEGGITTVTLNYPERRNAQTPEMRQYLADRIPELMADPECRAIVITGAGGHFSAGADVSRMKDVSIGEGRTIIEIADRMIRAIVRGSKPVVAAVEGLAYGAGMSLALACDYVIAASDAKFSPSFLKVGLAPDMGILWTLPQRVGAGRARTMLQLAQTVDGEEAHRIGMVEQVVAPGTALTAAYGIAAQYAAMPPLAMALTKAAIANGCTTLEEAFRAEVDYQPALRRSADHKEAVAAFLEKRTPQFIGK